MSDNITSFESAKNKPSITLSDDDFTDHVCSCGCKYFEAKLKFITLSAVRSPDGKPHTIPTKAFVCEYCGNEIDKEVVKNISMGQPQ